MTLSDCNIIKKNRNLVQLSNELYNSYRIQLLKVGLHDMWDIVLTVNN